MNGAVPAAPGVRDFAGKTVLVTGGAQGIGLGIAEAFAARGAAVAIADLRIAAASDAAQRIVRQGGAARAYEADMAEYESTARLVADVEADFGRLDVVVHNAAYFPLTAFDATLSTPLRRRSWSAPSR